MDVAKYMIDSFFRTESIIEITLVNWWICSFVTLWQVQVEIKYSYIQFGPVTTLYSFNSSGSWNTLPKLYFYIFVLSLMKQHGFLGQLQILSSAWIYKTEIMGEINQVVPNLISESISGRRKSRWSNMEADIPALWCIWRLIVINKKCNQL